MLPGLDVLQSKGGRRRRKQWLKKKILLKVKVDCRKRKE